MTREEVLELLPWYANGTLAPGEAREVEVLLARDAECAAELEELRVLQAAVAEVDETEPAFRPTAVRDALGRIDAYERERVEKAEASLGGRLRWMWESLRSGWDATPVPGRLALAVQLGLILALGAVLLRAPGTETRFETLAGGSATVGPRGGALVAVGFQPTVREADLRALLTELDAKIVAGPSAQELWVVELAVSPEEPERVAAGVERLRERADVVRYAEPRAP
jgi:anti-sigma factor RsiW